MCLLVVRREQVSPEVAAGAAQHGVRVITIVGSVVFDEQVSALYPVVVPSARRERSLPGEVQFRVGGTRSLPGRKLGRQPVEVEGYELSQHRSRARPEPGGGNAERFDAFPSAGIGAGVNVVGRLDGDDGGRTARRTHRVK
jgi:hypothetical protein